MPGLFKIRRDQSDLRIHLLLQTLGFNDQPKSHVAAKGTMRLTGWDKVSLPLPDFLFDTIDVNDQRTFKNVDEFILVVGMRDIVTTVTNNKGVVIRVDIGNYNRHEDLLEASSHFQYGKLGHLPSTPLLAKSAN